MNTFGQTNSVGGYQRNPSCQTFGSADPSTCFCKSNPSNGTWGGSSGMWWGSPGQQQQPQLPATVHIIVDNHIYEVNCDGTPIGQIVQAIKTHIN